VRPEGELGEVGFEAVEIGAEDAGFEEIADEFAVLFRADQARGFKFLHVMRKGRGADFDAVADVGAGDGVILCAQFLQNFIAPRIGQSASDALNLIFRELGGAFWRRHIDIDAFGDDSGSGGLL
jgi:hypothetical protein